MVDAEPIITGSTFLIQRFGGQHESCSLRRRHDAYLQVGVRGKERQGGI